MGCNFSAEPVKIKDVQESLVSVNQEVETQGSDKRSSITKSDESSVSLNGSIESDRLTTHSNSGILTSRKNKSIDLRNRNDSFSGTDPPVATATIIRGPATHSRSSIHNIPDITVSNQSQEVTSYSRISIAPQSSPRSRKDLNRRRSSDGDVGKVKAITCIPPSVIQSNPHLRSSFSETRIKPPNFGPRNSHLTLTESQKDFFRMLDEKVAQGKDYCSEDERSLASFRSVHRKDSTESGLFMGHIPQQVR